MKLLHTADWHLGKTLKGQNLLDDQKFIIDEIFSVINDEKPDAILISGDIYDRAVPPPDAVELFNETLNRFAEKNLKTLIISGNHDSATRLNFGSKLFRSKNIFIGAKIADEPENIVLEDNFGEIYFSLIPFVDSEKISEIILSARKKIPKNKRSVALAHAFLTGGEESESERKFVGGSGNVSAEIFANYNYVALGHLHKPQKISTENIKYAGSPLKYSFDEVNHKKSVTIIDIFSSGEVKTKEIPLIPQKNLIVVEGKFNELINRPKTEDYAQIILTDDFYVYETELLRNSFPNFLEIKRKNHLHSYEDDKTTNFHKEDTISEQFSKFFESVTSEKLTDDEKTAFEEILKELEQEDRE